MRTNIEIESNQCSQCANAIRKELGKLQGIFAAEVDFINGVIRIDHTDEVNRDQIVSKLSEMGYPEKGSTNAVNSPKPGSCSIK